MVILYFIIFSLCLSLSVFFIKNRVFHILVAVLYPITQIILSIYAYQNMNSTDSIYFKFDSLAVLFNGILSIILVPIFFHTGYYLDRHVPDRKKKGRFIGLMIILSTSISSIYFSNNFMLIWVSLEITSIVVTFLIYHERYTDALEAAWKYLFVSSFGITIAFLGLLFLSVQGTTDQHLSLSFSQMQYYAKNLDPNYLKIAFLLLITGYSVKMNVFPLFAATIDAKTAAPFPVNAIASTALINAGFISIIRIYAIISKTSAAEWTQHVLLIVGIISLLIASVQITRVKRFKRLYAFSSMEHMALVIIALSLGKYGYYAAILQLVLHSFAKTGMFLNFGGIRACFQSGWIKDSGNYLKLNGFGALVYLFGLLTITAIPPSGMFLSEFLIFKALFAHGQFYIALIILILLTIIIYILFQFSMQLLFGPTPDNYNSEKSIVDKFDPVSQLILFSFVIYLGYFPPKFFNELMNSVMQILY